MSKQGIAFLHQQFHPPLFTRIFLFICSIDSSRIHLYAALPHWKNYSHQKGTRHTLLGSIGSSFRCMSYTNNPLRYYTLLLSSQLHQAFISQAPWTHTSFSRYLGLSNDKGSFRHQSSFVSAHPGAHLHTSTPLGNRSHLIIIIPHCLRRDAVLHTRGKMAETRALQGIVRSHIAHPRTMFRYNGSRCEPHGVGCHNDDKPTHSLL